MKVFSKEQLLPNTKIEEDEEFNELKARIASERVDSVGWSDGVDAYTLAAASERDEDTFVVL